MTERTSRRTRASRQHRQKPTCSSGKEPAAAVTKILTLPHTGSSSSQCRDARYGCFSASSTLMRLVGLKLSILSSRSRPSGLALGNRVAHGTLALPACFCMKARARLEATKSMSGSLGEPSTSTISFSWWM